MKLCYFDNNATTPLADEARVAWLKASEQLWLNPSSPYRMAAAVKVRYEAARELLAERLDVSPKRLVFTSGATEANNDVFQYWARHLPAKAFVGVNPTEHPSVIEAAEFFLGERVDWLPVKNDGQVDLVSLDERINSGYLTAVSVMAANNETGVIQPWQRIAKICASANIPYHCDASQWVGKMPLDGLSDCSFVTACAHKFGGPKGVGFMLLPKEINDFSILLGGNQEKNHRAGTEDVAGVRAMIAALEGSTSDDSKGRDDFIKCVTTAITGIKVVGLQAPRLWNTVLLILPKHTSQRWIRALEKLGFLVSAGAACSSGKEVTSSSLLAIGVDSMEAGRSLRISSSAATTLEDWQMLAKAVVDAEYLLSTENSKELSSVISID